MTTTFATTSTFPQLRSTKEVLSMLGISRAKWFRMKPIWSNRAWAQQVGTTWRYEQDGLLAAFKSGELAA